MDLEAALKKFESFAGKENDQIRVTTIGPYLLKATPRHPPRIPRKTIGFLGIIHGNEVLGLSVLNQLLAEILAHEVEIDFEIFFGLGNIPAARAGKRFLKQDMNRCFGKILAEGAEALRAREIQTLMLDHCDYLVDIHQTIEGSKTPFFIFQYSSLDCLSIMKKLNSTDLPVILQFDNIGEDAGLTSDEYLRLLGGFGTTVELGSLNSGTKYLQTGLQICRNALTRLQEEIFPVRSYTAPLFKLSDRVAAEDDGTQLKKSIKNLSSVHAGEVLGFSEEGPIYGTKSGCALFPKKSMVNKGETLFHLCEPANFSEFFSNIKKESGDMTPLSEY